MSSRPGCVLITQAGPVWDGSGQSCRRLFHTSVGREYGGACSDNVRLTYVGLAANP